MKKIILIPDRILNPDIERNIFGDEYDIICPLATNVNEIDDGLWESANAILAWHDLKYDAELMTKLISCKTIVRVGVGYDNIDIGAAKDKNIIVCNVPDYGTNDVADHTIALMLALSRGLEKYNNEIKYNNKWEWNISSELKRLTGSTMGIIGLGRIGTATALRAKAFGMNIVFYDPYVPDGKDKSLMVTRCEIIDDLLELSDVVSIHTPLTNETKQLVNDNFFEIMKNDSLLVNTARGEIVDLKALYDALRNNQIKSAALVVLEKEPPDPDNPLIKAWRMDEEWIKGRLILTPHSAFYNLQSFSELREKAAVEALRILSNKNPKNRLV